MNSKIPGWGPWLLDPEVCVLYLNEPSYDIDLTQCATREGILGWLTHMASKTWMDDAKLAGLTRAMNELFNPHFSSTEFPMTERQIRAAVKFAAQGEDLIDYVCAMPADSGDLQ